MEPEKAENQELALQVDWGDLDRFPVSPINLATVQSLGDEVILNFGYAAPPLGIPMSSREEAEAFLADKPTVKPCHAFRLLMPLEGARVMIQGIADALQPTKEEDA